jgi:predicted nucleotide-binding protein
LGRVFIVHGHDEAGKHAVARLLNELLGVQPVILHEQANEGRLLLEKFERSAAASGYAVVLLTSDDLGRAKSVEAEQPRGRQNVIFEMGFFAGALGRARMSVLYDPGVEMPSDLGGLVYIERDKTGAWQTALARELDAVGFAVDWSALGRLA